MTDLIYFDNSATTRMSEDALCEYNRVCRENFANPSSLHSLGFSAEGEIRRAKEIITSSLKATGDEVVFCASGSEANNLAILGRAFAKERYKNSAKIITTMGEHASVGEPFLALSKMGFKVAYIPTKNGEIDFSALEGELTENVILASFMLVNNETGALYDLKRVSSMLRQRCPDALFHVDATQGYLKVPFTKASIGFDMITLSAHKIEGPKGIGALLLDKKITKSHGLSPIILGGGQGGGLRSGTENVAGIAAFARACEIGYKNLAANREKTESLRDYLIKKLHTVPTLKDIYVTLPRMHAPHILNITIPKIKSETMLHFLSSRGIFVSSGSACSSNSSHTSSALIAYGHTEEMADSSIRISFSARNEFSEIDVFIKALEDGLSSLARIKK